MQIIKRKSDNTVVFCGGPFELGETGAIGPDFRAPGVTSIGHMLEAVESAPDNFQPNSWTYDGTWQMTPEASAAMAQTAISELADAKLSKKADIQAEKVRIRDAGVMVAGVLFDTDLAARVSYQEFAMKLAGDPEYQVDVWKASAGKFVVMDAEKFNAVLVAGEQHMTPVYAWQKAKDKEVDDAENLAAVAAVTSVYPG